MSYSNILIAVDLSEQSGEVVAAAQAVARKTSARLHLATVIKPLTQVYGGLDMAPIASGTLSFEEEASQTARAQLETLAAEAGIASEDIHVRHGSPVLEIRALAAETSADLIVIGSHGRHGLGLLLGSTANGVLHDAPCSVLAVRLAYDGTQ